MGPAADPRQSRDCHQPAEELATLRIRLGLLRRGRRGATRGQGRSLGQPRRDRRSIRARRETLTCCCWARTATLRTGRERPARGSVWHSVSGAHPGQSGPRSPARRAREGLLVVYAHLPTGIGLATALAGATERIVCIVLFCGVRCVVIIVYFDHRRMPSKWVGGRQGCCFVVQAALCARLAARSPTRLEAPQLAVRSTHKLYAFYRTRSQPPRAIHPVAH